MSNTIKSCPQCAAPLPADAPRGLCPKCLMEGVLRGTETGAPVTTPIPKPVAPSPEQLAPFFPNLEILELIGQGGMGHVYKARQPQLDRLVALKILPAALADDPAFAERFSREGKLLAKLNHPNIVTVHDFGVAELTLPAGTSETVATGSVAAAPSPAAQPVTARRFFLLMEFMDGVNLRQAMHAGRFTPEQALGVVPKVCEALQYAHDEGVLHRDIKPENILVDAKGRVKIADFGIAKMMGSGDPGDIALTGAGATLGTPHYMAPEQIERPASVDHRADIYSLGVVFYEMLTGELPLGRFAAPSAKAAVNARIDEIVMRALEKERELRQQSATEIKTQVEGAGTQPAAAPRVGKVLKSAQCFTTTPAHLQTFKARFAHPFTAAGDLILESDRLVFESGGERTLIELKSIRDLSVGHLEWWSANGRQIALLSLTYEDKGAERTLVLRPTGPWPEPVWESNRHVADWAKSIREAVRSVSSSEPAETPANCLPLPPGPGWIKPAVIAAILFAPLFGFMGAEIVSNGERHQQMPVTLLGFLIIAGALIAAFSAFLGALGLVTTRWALDRGNLHGLTTYSRPAATPGAVPFSEHGVTTGVRLVVLYGGFILAMVGLSLLRSLPIRSDLTLVIGVFVFLLVMFQGMKFLGHGPLKTGTLRLFAWLATLMSLPIIAFGLFFAFALMNESGGWNPAPAEAIMVPWIWLGCIGLPWSAVRLHRAYRARVQAQPAAPHTGNPWPRRVYYLIICLIVVPIALFVIMLLVPYLAWRQSAQPHPTQVGLQSVFVNSNLVVARFDVYSRSGGFSVTPEYEGMTLDDNLIAATPTFPDTALIVPTPVGKRPLVENRFAATFYKNSAARYSAAFALPDENSARLAASRIQETFAEMRQGNPQVRAELFLFRLNENQPNETTARLRFDEARKIWVVGHVNPRHWPAFVGSEPKGREAMEAIQEEIEKTATIEAERLRDSQEATNAAPRPLR